MHVDCLHIRTTLLCMQITLLAEDAFCEYSCIVLLRMNLLDAMNIRLHRKTEIYCNSFANSINWKLIENKI